MEKEKYGKETEDILENLRRFVEFMGGKRIGYYFYLPKIKGFTKRGLYRYNNLKYETSWDWLVPVSKKILSVVDNVLIKNQDKWKSWKECEEWELWYPYFSYHFSISEIDVAYRHVKEFLEFYEKEKSNVIE